jgi:anaerobic magnesium-protoporphyrin IX monomethyl ester cyclase
MKILLLEHPRVPSKARRNDIANTTLASCLNSGYMAANLLAHGHQVALVEGYMEHLSYAAIEAEVAAFRPQLLAVHLVYNWEDNRRLFDFLTRLKGQYAIRHLSAYGYYPTFAYEEVLTRCPAIDSAMLGENEITVVQMAEHPDDWHRLRGLAFRNGDGSFTASFGEPVQDLDALPFPIRKATAYPGGEVNIFGSRGCYNNCTFCYINPFYGDTPGCPRWRGRSPENIAAEIDRIIAQTDHRYFYFTDPNFFGPGRAGRDRVLRLAALLAERPITFGIEARANDIDDAVIAALADAGLTDILVGLESGRQEALDRLGKHTTVSQNEAALAVLRRHGIEPNVGFIMFEPDSSFDDLRENFAFLRRNRLLDRLEIAVNVLYHHQIILAGSASYADLAAQGRLKISDHSVYEAETEYLDPAVGAFAAFMRGLTGHILDRMADTWQAAAGSDPAMRRRYAGMNKILVASFDAVLNDPSLLARADRADTLLARQTAAIDAAMA